MHIRLQTWLPLTVQVYVNGRAWLARQLTAAGIAVDQQDNALIPGDLPQARAISDQLPALRVGIVADAVRHPRQTRISWPGRPVPRLLLERARKRVCHRCDLRHRGGSPGDLSSTAASRDRTLHDRGPAALPGTGGARTISRSRPTVRWSIGPKGSGSRHWLDENSIKMYDKAARLLRVEMTLNNPDRFKVLRRRPSDRRLDWLPLRRGIADMRRRAELGRAAAARYLDALSVVGDPIPSHRLLDSVSQRVTRHGRPYRPLRPMSPQEAPLFRTTLARRIHAARISKSRSPSPTLSGDRCRFRTAPPRRRARHAMAPPAPGTRLQSKR